MALPHGFEPWTHGLEGRCSNPLSYRSVIGTLNPPAPKCKRTRHLQIGKPRAARSAIARPSAPSTVSPSTVKCPIFRFGFASRFP